MKFHHNFKHFKPINCILNQHEVIKNMNLEIKKMPANYRPKHDLPHPKMFELLGEKGIRQMVSDHYELLAESDIKDLFPPKGYGLDQAKERSADFFIQKLGGPEYYKKNRGEPKLSQRHSYFKITPESRITWLSCYREVLLKLSIPENVILAFWDYLHGFSNWMVNTQTDKNQFFINNEES